jgi:hypothetical protein
MIVTEITGAQRQARESRNGSWRLTLASIAPR